MKLKNSRIAASLVLVLLTAIFVQWYLHWPYQIRSSFLTINYWLFAIAALTFPVLLAWLVSGVTTTWARRVLLGLTFILALPCLLMSSCALLETPNINAVDNSYELLSEANDGALTYRLYRTNCGATCAYGLDLREELDLFLGFKLVSELWSKYRADQGQVYVNGSKIQVRNGSDILTELSR
jgi:hypothetical protein